MEKKYFFIILQYIHDIFFWKLFGEIHFQNFGPKWLPRELLRALCEVKSKSHVHRLKRSGSICPIFWAYFQDNRTSPRITRQIVRRGVLGTKFGGKIAIEIGGCSLCTSNDLSCQYQHKYECKLIYIERMKVWHNNLS